MYQDDELYHYGVKGMKWGVRRSRSSLDGNGSFRTRRLQRAVNANDRDVKSLKSAGYKKEAAAVKAVGDKNRAKLAKSQARDAARNTKKTSSRNAYNKNYSDRQRKNDRALYGNGAERRINRRLNKGYGLQGARHFEVERKERKEARKQVRDRAIKRGARAAKRLAKTGVTMWAYDQMFNGGRGTRAVKNGMKVAASLGVYAFKTARQAYWDTHPTYTVD